MAYSEDAARSVVGWGRRSSTTGRSAETTPCLENANHRSSGPVVWTRRLAACVTTAEPFLTVTPGLAGDAGRAIGAVGAVGCPVAVVTTLAGGAC